MAGAAVPAHADGDAAAHGRPPHVGRPRLPRLRPLAPLQATPVGKAILGCHYSVLSAFDKSNHIRCEVESATLDKYFEDFVQRFPGNVAD